MQVLGQSDTAVDMEALILTLRVQLIGPILRSDLELLYKQAGWVVACLAVDPLLSTNLVE